MQSQWERGGKKGEYRILLLIIGLLIRVKSSDRKSAVSVSIRSCRTAPRVYLLLPLARLPRVPFYRFIFTLCSDGWQQRVLRSGSAVSSRAMPRVKERGRNDAGNNAKVRLEVQFAVNSVWMYMRRRVLREERELGVSFNSIKSEWINVVVGCLRNCCFV